MATETLPDIDRLRALVGQDPDPLDDHDISRRNVKFSLGLSVLVSNHFPINGEPIPATVISNREKNMESTHLTQLVNFGNQYMIRVFSFDYVDADIANIEFKDEDTVTLSKNIAEVIDVVLDEHLEPERMVIWNINRETNSDEVSSATRMTYVLSSLSQGERDFLYEMFYSTMVGLTEPNWLYTISSASVGTDQLSLVETA